MKVTVTSEEFLHIVFSLLLEKIIKPDEILPNDESFNEMAELLKSKGLKPHLLKYYIDLDLNERMYYKRIKSSFEKKDNNFIEIKNNKKLNESIDISNDFYYIKTVIKKVVKILKQRKWLKGKITTENMLDKIINDVMEKEKQ